MGLMPRQTPRTPRPDAPELVRAAGVDCGTNTIRLLVLERAPDGARELARRSRVIRLGEGVDRTRRFAPPALARLDAALAVIRAELDRLAVPASRVRFAATSASRDVTDPAPLVDRVRSVLGVIPEVIAGTEEAALSFRGATAGLPRAAAPGRPDRTLVIDMGGGSTELVVGDATAGAVLAAHSMDVGSVRLAERHVAGTPLDATVRAAIARDVDRALDRAEQIVPLGGLDRVIGVSDSVGAIAAVAAGVSCARRAELSRRAWPVDALRRAAARIIRSDATELAALGVDPGRRDVVGAAAVIWDRVCARLVAAGLAVPIAYSEHDILDGVARSALERPDAGRS